MRPIGAPNLAYGDPDFSTNWSGVVGGHHQRRCLAATAGPLRRPSTDDTGAVIDPGGVVDLPDAGSDTAVDFGTDGGSALGSGANPSSGGRDTAQFCPGR